MKVKVMKRFRDKHTREIYKEGKVLNISKERFDEICKTDNGLVKEVETKKKETTAK